MGCNGERILTLSEGTIFRVRSQAVENREVYCNYATDVCDKFKWLKGICESVITAQHESSRT